MIEILQSMFSEHRGIKLEISNRREYENYATLQNSNIFLTIKLSKEDITEDIRAYFELNANKNTNAESYGIQLKQHSEESYRCAYLY